jgi:tetratricopeptide (TPR) repeat protein
MRLTLATMLALALLAGNVAARAEDKALGQKHFKAGVSLLKAEEYASAAMSFEASLEAFPTKNALFNLANCYKALKRYDEALQALARLRRDFAGKLGAELETEAVALEQEIRNLVGSLEIAVDRPGAAVLLDGREVGRAPLSRPLLLAPGNYEVTARLDGFAFAAETVRLLSGDEKHVRLAGREREAVPASPQDPSEPSTRSTQSTRSTAQPPPAAKPSPLFWAAAGGAVATGVLSGVFFGLRGRAAGAFEDARDDWDALTPAQQSSSAGDGPWSEMESAGEDYDKWNGAGIGMAVTAGAFAAAAVVILIVDPKKGDEAPAADTARARLRPNPGGMRIEF